MFRSIFKSKQQAAPQQTSKPIPGALQALKPETLLEPHTNLLNQIDALAGVSASHFCMYYLPAIQAYARFVQRLPARTIDHRSRPTGMLEHALDVVTAALKIRRSFLLPTGASTEDVAFKKDLWTYAVFAAALCHDLGNAVVDLAITIYDRAGNSVEWDPWAHYIDEQGDWYEIESADQCPCALSEKASPLLVHRILPRCGMKWLASDHAVFLQWLAYLSSDRGNAGAIGEIIGTADERLVSMYSGAKPMDEKIMVPFDSLVPKKNEKGESTAAESARLDVVKVGDTADQLTHILLDPTLQKEDKRDDRGIDADCCIPDMRNVPVEEGGPSNNKMLPKKSDTDRADQFLSWLRDSIQDRSIRANAPNSILQVVEEGVLLATPGIFKRFAESKGDAAGWVKIQKAFLKKGLHEKGAGGINVHKFIGKGTNAAATLNGILLRDASIVFGSASPPKPNRSFRKVEAGS